MNVQFYINTSPTIKVSKSLTAVGTQRTCDIMGNIDVVNPVIIVKGTVDSSVNYMIIGEPLNRRYFVTAMDYTTAGKVIIAGHCDVLSTYHGFLENTTLNYVRGAGDLTEMDDSSYPVSDYLVEQYFPMSDWIDIFTNLGSGRQYLLRTICGHAQISPTITISDISTGVIWCGRLYDDGGTTKYRCFNLSIQSGNLLVATPIITTDITNTPQVFEGYKIRVGNQVWQAKKGDSDFDFNPEFYYLGETT